MSERDRNVPGGKRLRRAFAWRLSGAAVALGMAAWLGAATAAAQQNLPRPTGLVLLIVSGEITNTNAPGRAEFDREMLESLGTQAIVTSSPWTDGKQRYEGVLARDVMLAVGARGQSVVARGLDDYTVAIPMTDFRRYPVILALKRDNAAMAVRAHGPVLIVYPRDSFAELKSPDITRKSVGMLVELIVQ
ncbi:MAG: molybdopterin-dependent oxidoreductase [Alphaproteobacteria bacterium]